MRFADERFDEVDAALKRQQREAVAGFLKSFDLSAEHIEEHQAQEALLVPEVFEQFVTREVTGEK